MNSLHVQNGNHWLELHSFLLVLIWTPPYGFFSLGKSPFWRSWCHSVWFFCFLTLVSLHMQKYNMKPSFNLCSSSHFKCLWKKHFIERGAVDILPVGTLLSTCFLMQEFVITLHRLRLWRWVSHFYPLLFISWSRINAMNARLWYGTRRLFELLKPCVGLMVVPRHERLVWARKGERVQSLGGA